MSKFKKVLIEVVKYTGWFLALLQFLLGNLPQ